MKKLIKCKSCSAEIAKSAKSCPSCGAKNKKPIYKKIWFWVIAVIIVVAATSGGSGDDTSDNTTQQTASLDNSTDSNSAEGSNTETQESAKEESKAIKSGTYKVGTDLAAGEYLFIAKNNGYVECTSDSTGMLEGIVFNENVIGNTYLTVNDGEYLKIQGGEMYSVADAPSIVPADGLYKDGMYKVGEDIPAGEYKVVLTNATMGYYEVASDSRHDLYSIVANENMQADTYLTVQDGQYLKINGAEIKK